MVSQSVTRQRVHVNQLVNAAAVLLLYYKDYKSQSPLHTEYTQYTAFLQGAKAATLVFTQGRQGGRRSSAGGSVVLHVFEGGTSMDGN